MLLNIVSLLLFLVNIIVLFDSHVQGQIQDLPGVGRTMASVIVSL